MIVLELEFKGIQKLFENAFGKICLENKKENEHLLPFLVFGLRAIPWQPLAQPRASAARPSSRASPAAAPTVAARLRLRLAADRLAPPIGAAPNLPLAPRLSTA